MNVLLTVYHLWRCSIMKQTFSDRLPSFLYRRSISTIFVSIAICCIFLLSACGGSATSPTTGDTAPKKGGTLSVGLIAEPTTMDPLTSVSLYDTDVMVNMYDTLLKYDEKNVIQPQLVASYAYD